MNCSCDCDELTVVTSWPCDELTGTPCGSLTHASCLDVRLDRTDVFKLSGGLFQCIDCAMNDTGFDITLFTSALA